MIYPIVKFGDPVLEKPAAPITVFDEELRKLADDMFESMYAAHGVGLAAPQIGIAKRIAVIDVTFKEDPEAKIVLVNPEIIHTEGRITSNEGCLSLPDFREKVTRARDRHSARAESRRQDLRSYRRGSARPRSAARNRSSQWEAVHQPYQRLEARHHEAQDSQAGEAGRMVVQP